MIMTQDALIKQIAEQEHMNTTTVRNVFRSAENILFHHLSSVAPPEHLILRILSGISLERKYIERKHYSKGMFQDLDCPEHVIVKANLSSYYSRRVNGELFSR